MSLYQDEMGPLAPQRLSTLWLAPAFAGYCAQCVFAGMALAMVISYCGSPAWRHDPVSVRAVIVLVMFLSAIQTALNIAQIMYYGITQKRSIDSLGGITVLDTLPFWPQALVAAISQIYLTRRACLVVERKPLRIAIAVGFALCIAAAFSGAVVGFARNLEFHLGETHPGEPFNGSQGVALYLVASAVVDSGVTIVLGMSLSKKILGFNEHTDSIIRRLIRLSLRTSAFTSVDAVIGAILSLAFGPDSDYVDASIPFTTILSSLYCISLLTTVSGRAGLASELSSGRMNNSFGPTPPSMGTTRPARVPPVGSWSQGGQRPGDYSIRLNTMQATKEDQRDGGAATRKDATSIAHGIDIKVERDEEYNV